MKTKDIVGKPYKQIKSKIHKKGSKNSNNTILDRFYKRELNKQELFTKEDICNFIEWKYGFGFVSQNEDGEWITINKLYKNASYTTEELLNLYLKNK